MLGLCFANVCFYGKTPNICEDFIKSQFCSLTYCFDFQWYATSFGEILFAKVISLAEWKIICEDFISFNSLIFSIIRISMDWFWGKDEILAWGFAKIFYDRAMLLFYRFLSLWGIWRWKLCVWFTRWIIYLLRKWYWDHNS